MASQRATGDSSANRNALFRPHDLEPPTIAMRIFPETSLDTAKRWVCCALCDTALPRQAVVPHDPAGRYLVQQLTAAVIPCLEPTAW
jgi:hypothetical protein